MAFIREVSPEEARDFARDREMRRLKEARSIATEEIEREDFRAMVDAEKARIKAEQSSRCWWRRFIPFTITITRRTNP